MLRSSVLLVALAAPCLSQSIEIVVDPGRPLPAIGTVLSGLRPAINSSGSWAASVGGLLAGGVVVDGQPLQLAGDALPGGGQLFGVTGIFIDSLGRTAYGVTTSPTSTERVVLVDRVEVLRSGDALVPSGETWDSFDLVGIDDNGRVYVEGTVLPAGGGAALNAFGYVDIDAAGTVVGRGVIALEGQVLPGGLGTFVGPVRSATVSSSGSVLWVGRRDSGSVQNDDFLLLDSTVLAIENDPSPVPGGTWRVGAGDLSLSPSGNHWSIAGWISGPITAQRFGVIVDGNVRHLDGDSFPSIAPRQIAGVEDAQVDDAGSVVWSGRDDRVDTRFGVALFKDQAIVSRPAADVIGGARPSILNVAYSPDAAFVLPILNAETIVSLARIEVGGAPLPCGSLSDPYEPNDDCATATTLERQAFSPTSVGATCFATRTDSDWYQLSVGAGEVLHVRAYHAAVDGEVDMEVYEGPCGSQLLVQSATLPTENEGLWIQGPASGTLDLSLRVLVPQRSTADCVEYRLVTSLQPQDACTRPGGFVDDFLEPNDACSTPTTVGVGEIRGLAVGHMSPDFFAYTLAPGASVTFELRPSPSNFAIDLDVVAEDCSGERLFLGGGANVRSVTASNFGTTPIRAICRVAIPMPWSFNGRQCLDYDFNVRASGDGVGYDVCGGVANSTGGPATLAAFGSDVAIANLLELRSSGLPPGTTGYFLASRTTATVVGAGGSQGTLCLGNPVGRILASVQSMPLGQASWRLNLAAIPQPNGIAAVVPGDRWNFQLWYRDANPQPTSNFSGAVGVLFR